MADDLCDVGHWFGGDLLVSATGDLARVSRADRSKQRVLRRLMTAPGDYLAHVDYGADLPGFIGDNLETARVEGVIRAQMRQEASVVQTPEPRVSSRAIANGVAASIAYTVAPEQVPAVLAFDVSA